MTSDDLARDGALGERDLGVIAGDVGAGTSGTPYTTASIPLGTAELGKRLVIARGFAEGELPSLAGVIHEAFELLAKDYRRRGWTLPAKAPARLPTGPKSRTQGAP